MSDANNALIELRAKINENRRLLERQEQALLVMEEMMGIAAPSAIGTTKPLDFLSPSVDVRSFYNSTALSKKTLKQAIKEVISKFENQEFTVPIVHEALEHNGVKLVGSQPRSKISTKLTELVEDKFLVYTYRSTGGNPSRYKLASSKVDDTDDL